MNKMNKATKRRLIITGIVCLVLWVASYFIGYYVVADLSLDIQTGDISLASFTDIMNATALYVTPVLFVLQLIFTVIYTVCCYAKAKKLYASWDGEDEDTVEKSESLISGCIAVLSVAQIISMLFFGVIVYATYDKFMSEFVFWAFMLLAVLFIGEALYITFMQRCAVQLTKKINPEKQGEVLDIKFAKDWEASMDEAQKAITFECGYRAYKVCIYTCMVLWLVCLFGIYFGMGIMPMLMVSVVWLTTTLTYIVKSYNMEHRKGRK
ncbi:MAG: DUF3169 family protein [Ruminococcus sp.]|nr:DUF3169 family protein [Ruminococcus sp.]